MTRTIWTLAFLLILPATAAADPWSEALHTELETGRLDEALRLYRQVERSQPELAEQAHFRQIIVLARLGSKPALVKEAKRFRKAYPDSKRIQRILEAELEPKTFIAKQQPAAVDLSATLKQRRVTLNFPDTPLEECVAFLQDISGLNIMLLPEVDPTATVSLRLRDVSMANAIELMLNDQALEMTQTCGSLVIGKSPQRVARTAFTSQDVAKYPRGYLALKQNRLTLNFDHTPLTEVVQFFQDITGVNLHRAKDVDPDAEVTFRVRDVSLESALALVCAQTGASYDLRGDAIELKRSSELD